MKAASIGKALLGAATGTLLALTATKIVDDRRVNGIWEELEEGARVGVPFSESMVATLPDPARRFFLHAIEPGTPLASKLRWSYSAKMRLGADKPWMDLKCEQIVVKERGFVWKTTARNGLMVMTGADYYIDGEGRMRIALYGLVPVVNATGPDLSRSAMARLVMEEVSLPSSLLPGRNVRIEGIDESNFRATVSLHGYETPVTITVDQEGRPTQFSLERWGNVTPDGSFRNIPYGAVLSEEQTFGGYTISTRMAGGWWYGTDKYLEVMRLKVDEAEIS